MTHHHLLWAIGPDRPGIVAALTKILVDYQANLEDSSMMKLGSEFGVFLIFTTPNKLQTSFSKEVHQLSRYLHLTAGFKPISSRLAMFSPPKQHSYMVTLHGGDRPGLVHSVTSLLARYKFNVSDLETHRVKKGKRAGYILFIEGSFPARAAVKPLTKSIARLAKTLRVHISIKPIISAAL